MPFNRFSEAR